MMSILRMNIFGEMVISYSTYFERNDTPKGYIVINQVFYGWARPIYEYSLVAVYSGSYYIIICRRIEILSNISTVGEKEQNAEPE